ncbi:MAG: hypothetical protein AUI14_04250 [Actinobacteria bacterium 13_2_20CM_2_71_6]|nr:MAG: hypothetical protein AUI14_04250 [Actinobacteria bacterium 13_2_20CM_2_71_6]
MTKGSASAPVFVDRTGTRRQWFTWLGVLGGALLCLATVVLVAGFLGGGPGYLPGLPAPAPDGGRAAASPTPAGPAPSATSRAPRRSGSASPATGGGTTPASPAPTASPSPTGHGNAPPHPGQSKKK